MLKWLQNNYWRFLPNTWLDWVYYWYFEIKDRIRIWYFWWSPFWMKTKRCPCCAGEKGKTKYNEWRECECCNGSGEVYKY